MYKKIILVTVDKKYLLSSSRAGSHKVKTFEDTIANYKENVMDFTEAVKNARDGKSLTRPNWEEGMRMWWSGEILVHSHPFEDSQKHNPQTGGYIYVCEKDDALAKDWKVVAC